MTKIYTATIESTNDNGFKRVHTHHFTSRKLLSESLRKMLKKHDLTYEAASFHDGNEWFEYKRNVVSNAVHGLREFHVSFIDGFDAKGQRIEIQLHEPVINGVAGCINFI